MIHPSLRLIHQTDLMMLSRLAITSTRDESLIKETFALLLKDVQLQDWTVRYDLGHPKKFCD
jgi:hypothetical protein